MKKVISLLVVLTVLSPACKKINIGQGTPWPIKREIRKFDKNALCNDARVDRYRFQNAPVYVFEAGTCGADMQSAVYDCHGAQLGSLGGFTGNMTIHGENFDSAVLEKTVWKKQ
jgi:hypothetical protein